jgi:hypothetical protein
MMKKEEVKGSRSEEVRVEEVKALGEGALPSPNPSLVSRRTHVCHLRSLTRRQTVSLDLKYAVSSPSSTLPFF